MKHRVEFVPQLRRFNRFVCPHAQVTPAGDVFAHIISQNFRHIYSQVTTTQHKYQCRQVADDSTFL